MKKRLFICLIFASVTGFSQVTIVNNTNLNGFVMTNSLGGLTRSNGPNGVSMKGGGISTYSCSLDTTLNLTCFDSLLITCSFNRGPTIGTSSLNGISASPSAMTYSYVTSNTSNLSFSITVANVSLTYKQFLYISNLKILGYQTATSCTAAPNQPLTINGPTTVCAGATNLFFTPPICGATSYTWALPSGWTGTSTTNTISVTSTSVSGSISVTATNSCGVSTPQTISVSVNNFTPAVPGAISGATVLCYGATSVYSFNPVAGATSYSWGLPSGWGYTNPSITNTISAIATSSGTISVTASNFCNSSSAQTYSVAVFPQNNVSVTINPNPICVGQSATLTMSCSKLKWGYWNISGGNPLVVTPTVNTNYQASTLDSNNCSSSIWSTVIVLTCTEIDRIGLTNNKINISPNPNSGEFILNSSIEENGFYEIYNCVGQKIRSGIVNEKTQISLKEEASGIYFIKVFEDNKLISTKKIIIN
jgi:hypothetical protein